MFWKNFASYAFYVPAGCFFLWILSTLGIAKFFGKDALILQWDLILGKIYWIMGGVFFIGIILGGWMGMMPDPSDDE